MKISVLLFVCMFFVHFCSAQISVVNPSFEDEPSDATTPQGWLPCNDLTTPDILPGFWGVYNEPSHGNTYVGIITRENGTYETFGQRLSVPLKEGSCYFSEIDLAHSTIYSGYNKPIKLRIYVGQSKCSKDQLIFESPLIDHKNWKTFKFNFYAKGDYEYITLEAYISEGEFSHKGNILIDKLRPILRCGNA
ncbi:MAG: hypothetical protein P1U56_16205 [Saprospiraceae bacterium]|nr:hypothetical protein [Saprospiraceae bacterium]